jgi:hypothetical protein
LLLCGKKSIIGKPLFLIGKKGDRAGNLESVGRISGEQVTGSWAARYGRLGEPSLPIFFRKNAAAPAVPSIYKGICINIKRLSFEKLAMGAGSFEK